MSALSRRNIFASLNPIHQCPVPSGALLRQGGPSMRRCGEANKVGMKITRISPVYRPTRRRLAYGVCDAETDRHGARRRMNATGYLLKDALVFSSMALPSRSMQPILLTGGDGDLQQPILLLSCVVCCCTLGPKTMK